MEIIENSLSSSLPMGIIENITNEYNNYFDTTMFFQDEELNGLAFMGMAGTGDHGFCSPDGAAGYGESPVSSSLDGGASSPPTKNIASERNRRKKLKERLLALREAVPKISKLDKPSIIKDAIDYIQELLEQESRIQAELKQLESEKLMEGNPGNDFEFEEELPAPLSAKKRRVDQFYDSRGCTTSPIEVLELGIDYMGEKTLLVTLKCVKRTETIVKLCEVFESLNLKTIAANITTVSRGLILKTVFVEADEEEKDYLKIRIERAITALNDTPSVMNM